MRNFWNEEIETASTDEITHLQSERLKAVVKYVYEKNEVYRRKFDDR